MLRPALLPSLCFVLWGVGRPLIAAERWIRLTTDHFQLNTTADEKQARAALEHLEFVHSFFRSASPFQKALDVPVRIVAFNSADRYNVYRPSESAVSFYTRNDTGDYIVMQDLDPADFSYAVHEYTHLVIARSGLHIPVWLNEGWADLNSTLKSKGGKAMIGDIMPARRDALLHNRWIPLGDLDKIDQTSPIYNEREQAGIFYGESWALVHMLFLAPEYRSRFDNFVRALVSGKSMAEAFQTALGKSTAQVESDLHQYLDRNKLFGAVFKISANSDGGSPSVSIVTPFESESMLADILFMVHKFGAARAAYEALNRSYPNRSETEEALGYLDFREGHRAEATEHFKKALASGTADARFCYRISVILEESQDWTDAVQALKRCLEIDPDYPDARLHLGIALLETQDFKDSLLELQKIRKITEKNAPWFFSATAIDQSKLGNSEESRKNAAMARSWAKSPAQQKQVEQILDYLDGNDAAKPNTQ